MTPIVIISYNRLEVLKSSIASYRKIADSVIVIHDTGSSYEPLLEYLRELEKEGILVYRNQPQIVKGDDLNSVDMTIQRWLKKYNKTQNFVVTDPDVMLEDDCEDILEFYKFVMDVKSVPVIGPMLRIDDIPSHYPFRNRVIDGHTYQYWSKVPELISWNSKVLEFQKARIDTTFGMYSSKNAFKRYQLGIRTYKPYWAKHLDWYIDPENMTSDQVYYLKTATDVSHWGGTWLRNKLYFGIEPPAPGC